MQHDTLQPYPVAVQLLLNLHGCRYIVDEQMYSLLCM